MKRVKSGKCPYLQLLYRAMPMLSRRDVDGLVGEFGGRSQDCTSVEILESMREQATNLKYRPFCCESFLGEEKKERQSVENERVGV